MDTHYTTKSARRLSLRITEQQDEELQKIIKLGQYLKEAEILRKALNIGLKEIIYDEQRGEK